MTEKKKPGPKPLKPTDDERRLVEGLSGLGLPQDDICLLIRDGISKESLFKYFPAELKKGKAKANSKISQTLFNKAISGDNACLIFWAKTQMRWRETNVIEHTGKDGGPIESKKVELTHEQLIEELKERGLPTKIFE